MCAVAFDGSAVRVGRARRRGRYFRETFAQAAVDLVQIIPEPVTNADAAIAASGREHGRIVLAFAAPDPDLLADWRARMSPSLTNTFHEHEPVQFSPCVERTTLSWAQRPR